MTVFEVIGWCGNAAFFSRFFWQWLASERAGRSMVPTGFWWLSLAGAVFVGAYAAHVGDPVLLPGLAVNGAIYARNLALASRPKPKQGLGPIPVTLMALLAATLLFALGALRVRENWRDSSSWIVLAALGQGIWSSRFVLQWWFSERRGLSHFPAGFWWLSLIGNGLLLAYSVHLGDPIFVAGFLLGPVVQTRNLMLLRREARQREELADYTIPGPVQAPEDASVGGDEAAMPLESPAAESAPHRAHRSS